MQTFTTTDPIIKATNLHKEINLKGSHLVILNKVSLEIKRGESVAIMGPSGAGKTTLLGLLAGLDVPSSGTVQLGGVDIYSLDEEARTKVRGKNISYIFQNFYLLENLTALENVMLPLELHYADNAEQQAIELLTKVGLADRMHHQPRQLSGGEQQRVAIARAFATKPAILFADEPTGNLDQATGKMVVNLLFELNKKFSTTLVIITHEPTLAGRCNRAIHLNQGDVG